LSNLRPNTPNKAWPASESNPDSAVFMTYSETRIGFTKKLLSIAFFLVLTTASFAMDLAEMLDLAVQNDTRLKVLSASLENTLLGIERARLAPGLNFELSTGDIQTAYSFNPREDEPEWLVSFNPSAALVLGRKSETEISAELPVGIGWGNTREFTILPQFAVRQPLDKLFDGEKFTEVETMQNRYAAEKSRVDMVKRVKEVEQDLLRRLSTLTEMQQQAAALKRELASAREAREESLTLQSYAEGSAQARRLEFTVNRLERQAELQEKRFALAWKELERIVGKPVEKLPGALPEAPLQIPDPASAPKNPDVYLASLALEVEKARLEEQRQPEEPRFFIGSALGSTYDEDDDETTTRLMGTVEGEFEDFKFTTGVGGILETRSVFVTFGLSWSFPDKKIESINLEEQENMVDIARWNLSSARENYFQTRDLLALEVDDLDYRTRDLDEQRNLAELELEAGRRSRQLGLIAEQELDDLHWALEKLDYTKQTLQLEKLLAASRLDALAPLETETE
jgi:hypothetical protein